MDAADTPEANAGAAKTIKSDALVLNARHRLRNIGAAIPVVFVYGTLVTRQAGTARRLLKSPPDPCRSVWRG